jgi:hypothetical protein
MARDGGEGRGGEARGGGSFLYSMNVIGLRVMLDLYRQRSAVLRIKFGNEIDRDWFPRSVVDVLS